MIECTSIEEVRTNKNEHKNTSKSLKSIIIVQS